MRCILLLSDQLDGGQRGSEPQKIYPGARSRVLHVIADVLQSGRNDTKKGENYRRKVHDRARNVGLEPDQD